MLNSVSQVKVPNLVGCTQSNQAFGNLTQTNSVSSASSNLNLGMRHHTLPQDSFTFTGQSKTGTTPEDKEPSSLQESSKKRKRGEAQADETPKPTNPDDWADVLDPQERRRIQNRIAQRKLRKNVKEKEETKIRDENNMEMARKSAEARAKFWKEHTYIPVDENGNWDYRNHPPHPEKQVSVRDAFGQERIVHLPYAINGFFWDPQGFDALRAKDEFEEAGKSLK